MLMGGHKPPQDVVDFAKRARAADGLAGQVSKHHHASSGACCQSGMYQAKELALRLQYPCSTTCHEEFTSVASMLAIYTDSCEPS